MSSAARDDEPSWAELRREMVATQLASRGIHDPEVLRAMNELAREAFVPPSQRHAAYEDRALPVGPNQTISQPYMVALMTQQLAVAPGQRVLEVGGGTGYQSALLSMLGGRVISIECDPILVQAARARLARLNIQGVEFHCGDGSLGFAAAAPFDRIVVTAGAPHIPPALIEQLIEGGRLLIPLGTAARQVLMCVIKTGYGIIEHPSLACRFVKLLGEQGWGEDAPAEPE